MTAFRLRFIIWTCRVAVHFGFNNSLFPSLLPLRINLNIHFEFNNISPEHHHLLAAPALEKVNMCLIKRQNGA